MKAILTFLFLSLFVLSSYGQEVSLKFEPNQSMGIAGLKPGQNAAINPYAGQKSIAVVENASKYPFSVRIQRGRTIVKEIPVKAKETLEFVLEKDQAFYLDATEATKALVSFKKYEADTPDQK
ncbi:MAG: hypothetical protein AAFR61_07590 [Bacteroidota bacterium]